MRLSVVIVNYNVAFFLEQCLLSVKRAMNGIDGEIIVVDNNSVDESNEMLRQKFPDVILIANKENTGFSKANNQAIRISKGEYVLLLNPDTVVEEDTFETCIRFMDKHPEAGACGVKLIDGKGLFLPESKRGLPTPSVAFYKISGLSALFPRSKRFGKYHLGYLDKEQTNEVEVLSGAFMFIRKAALDKAGLLDEDFFMYGEDIDLSYRICKAGYKIYYHPATRVIHYRGESTKKSSINYVFVFYQAMIIFAKKHFSQKNARFFGLLINAAIYLRAAISVLKRILKASWLPLVDGLFFFFGMVLLKDYWAARSGVFYPYEFIQIAVPLYILAWIGGIWMNGGYDRPHKLSACIQGTITGTLVIVLIYSMLDEQYRYSRFLTLVGGAYATVAAISVRVLQNLLIYKNPFHETNDLKRILIIGELTESKRIKTLINQSPIKASYIGIVDPAIDAAFDREYAGSINRLREMVEIFGINELIFCGKSLSSAEIMNQMMLINHPELEYKIAPPESLFIIGSSSIQRGGEYYTIELNAINKPGNKRKKRILDVLISGLMLLGIPVFLIIPHPVQAWLNILSVFTGKKTLVGYTPGVQLSQLPPLKQGVLHPLDPFSHLESDNQTREQCTILYAKDYRIKKDLEIFISSYKLLGRKLTYPLPLVDI
jgi:GT2 family glycosyltransferase